MRLFVVNADRKGISKVKVLVVGNGRDHSLQQNSEIITIPPPAYFPDGSQ